MDTFTFDPHKGMTLEQVKQRCRELSRALTQWQMIALLAYEGKTDELPERDKQALQRLKAAYED
jgi:hypothetical protein